MEPLISVIVPVYKVEDYLQKCIESILGQTYHNLELILVDDGSPDRCPEICDNYASKDKRVSVIHKANGGLSDARNAGMAVAKGEYLIFVDSDDLLPVDAVEALLDIAMAENADMVIGDHKRFEEELPAAEEDQSKSAIQRLTGVEAMADMLRNGCASWARIYRTEIHRPILFPVGEINEDEAIVLELLERCRTIIKTTKNVYYYRCRPESITTARFSEKKMDWYYHCVTNLAWIQERYPALMPLALDRLGSCIVFLLHQMALCGYRDRKIAGVLLDDLKKGYDDYQKNYLSGKKEKLRMWFLNYFPYSVYCALIAFRRRFSI